MGEWMQPDGVSFSVCVSFSVSFSVVAGQALPGSFPRFFSPAPLPSRLGGLRLGSPSWPNSPISASPELSCFRILGPVVFITSKKCPTCKPDQDRQSVDNLLTGVYAPRPGPAEVSIACGGGEGCRCRQGWVGENPRWKHTHQVGVLREGGRGGGGE